MGRKRAFESAGGTIYSACRLLAFLLAAATVGLTVVAGKLGGWSHPVLYAALAYAMFINLLELVGLVDKSHRLKRIHPVVFCVLDVTVFIFVIVAITLGVATNVDDGKASNPDLALRYNLVVLCMAGALCSLHLSFSVFDCIVAFRQPKQDPSSYPLVPSVYANPPPANYVYAPVGPPPPQGPSRFGESYY